MPPPRKSTTLTAHEHKLHTAATTSSSSSFSSSLLPCSRSSPPHFRARCITFGALITVVIILFGFLSKNEYIYTHATQNNRVAGSQQQQQKGLKSASSGGDVRVIRLSSEADSPDESRANKQHPPLPPAGTAKVPAAFLPTVGASENKEERFLTANPTDAGSSVKHDHSRCNGNLDGAAASAIVVTGGPHDKPLKAIEDPLRELVFSDLLALGGASSTSPATAAAAENGDHHQSHGGFPFIPPHIVISAASNSPNSSSPSSSSSRDAFVSSDPSHYDDPQGFGKHPLPSCPAFTTAMFLAHTDTHNDDREAHPHATDGQKTRGNDEGNAFQQHSRRDSTEKTSGKEPKARMKRRNRVGGPLQHVVAAVITDGKFSDRIDALLGIDRTCPVSTAGDEDESFSHHQHYPKGWLRSSFHTFLMFDARQPLSRERARTHYEGISVVTGDVSVAEETKGKKAGSESKNDEKEKNDQTSDGEFPHGIVSSAVTVEFIDTDPSKDDTLRKAPNAAWKPWSVVLFLAQSKVQRFLKIKTKYLEVEFTKNDNTASHESSPLPSPSPLWYAIIDDDAFTFPYALAYVLEPYARQMLTLFSDRRREQQTSSLPMMSSASVEDGVRENPTPSPAAPFYFYGGHRITYCPNCNPKKRFPFVFGGNGIFLSRDATLALAAPEVVAECRDLFALIAGDEQIGGCVARSATIRKLHDVNVQMGVDAQTNIIKTKEEEEQKKKKNAPDIIGNRDDNSHETEPRPCSSQSQQQQQQQHRSHYGFQAVDLFKGAVYDTPSSAIGSVYYINQQRAVTRREEGDAKKSGKETDESAAGETPSSSSTSLSSVVAAEQHLTNSPFPPFPISFHHIKNMTEMAMLSFAEDLWDRLVDEALRFASSANMTVSTEEEKEKEGVVNKMEAFVDISTRSQRRDSPVRCSSSASLMPFSFLVGALLPSKALMLRSAIVHTAGVVAAGHQIHHHHQNATRGNRTAATVLEMLIDKHVSAAMSGLRPLVSASSLKSECLFASHFNIPIKLYPFYYDPILIPFRLKEGAAKMGGKRKRRR